MGEGINKVWRNGLRKFELWHMTEYKSVLWLDADIKILKNLDGLFEDYSTPRFNLVAHQQCTGSDIFLNSGALLVTPDPNILQQMLDFAASYYGYGMYCEVSEQGLISDYFESKPIWSINEISIGWFNLSVI